MEELKQRRHQWLNSYLKGNIQLLQTIELPSFTVVSEGDTEHSSSRYSLIESKKQSGEWFNSHTIHEESELTYLTNKNKCNVSGHQRILDRNREVLSEVEFKEYWVRKGKDWFIESLHEHQIQSVS